MHSSCSLGAKHPSGLNTEAFAVKDQDIWEDQARTHPCRFAGCSGTFHLSPAEIFHLFLSTGSVMKRVKILGEVHSERTSIFLLCGCNSRLRIFFVCFGFWVCFVLILFYF